MTKGYRLTLQRSACLGLAVTLLLAVHGCAGTPTDDQNVPPDFALELTVKTVQPAAQVEGDVASANRLGVPNEQAMRQPSQYVLEPNRRLHVAIGPYATERYFPGVTRLLKPDDMQTLWQIIRSHHLLAEPTSPKAKALLDNDSQTQPTQQEVIYRVRIRASGRIAGYATTPEESPPTVRLLAELVRLRELPGQGFLPTSPGNTPLNSLATPGTDPK
ncbi:MAG: hypothetical protein IT443_11610 [Phycisphaeraceae bacterium]|nr:hypothetical protein [Phycisphaeraceae bacterium]